MARPRFSDMGGGGMSYGNLARRSSTLLRTELGGPYGSDDW